MEPQATAQPSSKVPLSSFVMDVVAPPPTEKAAGPAPQPAAEKPKHEEAKKTEHKPEKPQRVSTGVGAAIFATVVIVLGLAALATYAYLKTVR